MVSAFYNESLCHLLTGHRYQDVLDLAIKFELSKALGSSYVLFAEHYVYCDKAPYCVAAIMSCIQAATRRYDNSD